MSSGTVQPLGPLSASDEFIVTTVVGGKLWVLVDYSLIDDSLPAGSLRLITAYVVDGPSITINPLVERAVALFRMSRTGDMVSIIVSSPSSLAGRFMTTAGTTNVAIITPAPTQAFLTLKSNAYSEPSTPYIVFSGASYTLYDETGTRQVSFRAIDGGEETIVTSAVYFVAANFFLPTRNGNTTMLCNGTINSTIEESVDAFNCSIGLNLNSNTSTYCTQYAVTGWTQLNQCQQNPRGFSYCTQGSTCGDQNCYGVCSDSNTPCVYTDSTATFGCPSNTVTYVQVESGNTNFQTQAATPPQQSSYTWVIVLIIIIIVAVIVIALIFHYRVHHSGNSHYSYAHHVSQ